MKRIVLEMLSADGNSIQKEVKLSDGDKVQISYPPDYTIEQANRLLEQLTYAFQHENTIFALPENVKLYVIHTEDD